LKTSVQATAQNDSKYFENVVNNYWSIGKNIISILCKFQVFTIIRFLTTVRENYFMKNRL